VTSTRRLVLCTLLGVLAGHYAFVMAGMTDFPRDFGQVWFAARAVLHGQDPYPLIGPGLAFDWPAPLFYPLPAALVGSPLAPLDYSLAVGVFAGLGIFAFAWALSANGTAPMLGLLSACTTHAVYCAQWSPLLAGAVVLTPLSALLVAKPTIGLAVFAARPSWWAVTGAVVLTVTAFLVQPSWVADWREALSAASVGAGKAFPYSAPVMLPGGLIPLLALLRWRRPEARLLAVMACVPQTLLPYEGVLLFLIPRGWLQSAALMLSSHAMVRWVRVGSPSMDLAQDIAIYGPAMVAFLYVPATLMVLARPNEGWVPTLHPGWLRWLPSRA
jgi:hypothetical protein